MTLLSGYWPTDWIIYGWLIDWLTDSTVQGLSNWCEISGQLNCLSGDWPNYWMFYGWLIDWITHSTEWFQANWIRWGLIIWVNDLWQIELFGDWPTDWTICGELNIICPGTDHLTELFMASWLTVTCILEKRILEPSGSTFIVDKRKTQKIYK